jgi:hypothetical protein
VQRTKKGSTWGYAEQGIIRTAHANARSGRKIGSSDKPHRVVDFESTSSVDNRLVEREGPTNVGLCPTIEMGCPQRGTTANQGEPAERYTRNRECRKEERLIFPVKTWRDSGDHGRAQGRSSKPDAHHRRRDDLDNSKNRCGDEPMPELHIASGPPAPQTGQIEAGGALVGGRATVGPAARESAKLSRATSAIPASDPIIAALSRGIRITF